MRKQVLASVVVGVFALGLAGSLAWAAGPISVNIPFSFIVKDKEMPAGRYEIRTEGHDERTLAIRSKAGGGQVLVQVIERLADTGAKEPKVIFNKTEDANETAHTDSGIRRDGPCHGVSAGGSP